VTDTNVFQLVQPGTFSARLTEVWRDGAQVVLESLNLDWGAMWRTSNNWGC
jgi:hypothetical protein